MEQKQQQPSNGSFSIEVSVSDAIDIQRGMRIGEYEVEAKIGGGGFGAVYAAVHPVIGKQVAIKVLHAEFSRDAQIASRFVSEARAVNKIGHPNIVDIFAFGELPDGRRYFVMERMHGGPLEDYLAKLKKPLSPADAMVILEPIARALDAAHAAGIIHRDLKPGNIFLSGKDGPPTPKLLDFGLAKLVDERDGRAHVTKTGAVMGTPLYMSPEQCAAESIDHRTDIYAFGLVAYEMMTGKRPFLADSYKKIMAQHMFDMPPEPTTLCPGLSSGINAALLRMLEKDKSKRPMTLGEAMAELRAGVDVPNKRLFRPVRLVVAAALLAIATATVVFGIRSTPEVIPEPAPRAPNKVVAAPPPPPAAVVQTAIKTPEPTPVEAKTVQPEPKTAKRERAGSTKRVEPKSTAATQSGAPLLRKDEATQW